MSLKLVQTKDIEDFAVNFRNADPATKAAVLGILGAGTGAIVGGAVKGKKGMLPGAGIGAVAGGAAGAAIPKMSAMDNWLWNIQKHPARASVLGGLGLLFLMSKGQRR